ncbi:unnamed protein product [Timema podura]|uniref:Uncharacterized protein n=1 Tax=Timema podura TaxID=61482 RepID=A0ABN7NJ48_TIMPD|nr:unnamed protein product [Timema podura]
MQEAGLARRSRMGTVGKWFNYGINVMVMLLDLNMWKNQIFYDPRDFGQYTGPDDKIRTVNDQEILLAGNTSHWTWESRSHIDPSTGLPYYEETRVITRLCPSLLVVLTDEGHNSPHQRASNSGENRWGETHKTYEVILSESEIALSATPAHNVGRVTKQTEPTVHVAMSKDNPSKAVYDNRTIKSVIHY